MRMKAVFDPLVSLFESVLDAIMPLRERTRRTRERRLQDIPLSPTTHALLGVTIVTLMDYRVHAVEDLVRSLKYDGAVHAARLAADLLADYLSEEIASHRLFSHKRIMLIPVPLHGTRKRKRGFNQTELVLRGLPLKLQSGTMATVRTDILVRTRATKQQTHFSRAERLENVAGAFALTDSESVRGAHVFLVDDVVTTGATLVNAAAPLKRAGASVSLIALARA
jgi:ComF family protein